MNTIMRIVLALMLTVFLGSVALAGDSSHGSAWQGFYGPSISPSERPAESLMSSSAEDHSIAFTAQGFYGPSISPSGSSEGVALERPATSGTSLCANAVMEPVLDGPAISPSNSTVEYLVKQC